jgi:nucleotidyltransferase/DNA polymerase involved in DNA repair
MDPYAATYVETRLAPSPTPLTRCANGRLKGQGLACEWLAAVALALDVYRAVSQQIHAIFKDYTPLVKPLSLSRRGLS